MKTMFIEYGDFIVEIIVGLVFMSVISAIIWPIIQKTFLGIITLLV